MPVFALYNLTDPGSTAVDAAAGNGQQNGLYLNGAASNGSQVVLDGVDDLVKIYPDPTFQLTRGTLDITFTTDSEAPTGTQTVLSRDSVGDTAGGFRVELLTDGSVVITHETGTGPVTYTTAPGFVAPGDTVDLSYSWDAAEGGRLVLENSTQGTEFEADTPAGLTMDQGPINQPWMIGADQSNSDPSLLNNLDQHFKGTVDTFSLSDTVDNGGGDDEGELVANPDTAETDEDVAVTIDVLGNDSDPEGQALTVTGATATNGTVVVNPDGTITYTPNADFNGEDEISYTITDPDGNEATSYVTVTVNPVDDAPVANDDSASTTVGVAVTIPVLLNDTDADGDALSVTGTPTSADGTVVVNGDGTLTFTPNAGFTGEATITYTITDPSGLTDTATVTVTVTDPITGDRDGIVTGTDGDDLINGGYIDPTDGDRVDANDAIIPGDGPNDDRIVGGGGNDTAYGGLGNDTVDGGDGNDSLDGGVGNDVIDSTGGGALPLPDRGYPGVYPADSDPTNDLDTLFGGAGNDTLLSGDDNDLLYGGDGNDSLDGGIDDDRLYGGRGNDTIVGGEGSDLVEGQDGNDLIYGGLTPDFPDAVNIPDATDLRPDNGRDTLLAGSGDDTVYGLDDDDSIQGGSGNDLLFGGIDDDTVIGGAGNDVVHGDDGNDLLTGDNGVDTLFGGTGDDTLAGGAEGDSIYGGDGNDSAIGGTGGDLIDTAGDDSSPDRDFPGLYPADTDPDDDRDTVSAGAGDDTIRTGDDADTIHAGSGNDLVDAGVDDDSVTGAGGNDTILAGEGSDTVTGDLGNDLIYGGTEDTDTDPTHLLDGVDPDPDNNRDSLFGGLGDDTLYGQDDDDTLEGGQGNDLIYGGIDEDQMSGSAGNDTLIGGQGADTMVGGGDRDVFLGADAGDVVDGSENGDDFDVLDLRGSGPVRVTYSDDNPENGSVDFLDADGNVTGSMTFTNIENVIPCFTPGTLIATPRGEIPVEELRAGDRVITRDNGIQQIRWVGRKDLTWADLSLNPHLKPILIRKGSLGNGLPERDMMVSPNHRVLVANDRTALYFDEHEVLVAAKHLVAGRGVHEVDSMGTSYLHFMFDRHEVVLSNGAWTESFQPGDYTLKGMGNAQRNEIFELFPELKSEEGREAFGAARRTLKKHEAKLLLK